MGNILYGYEGWRMPVLFTKKGIIYLQRKKSDADLGENVNRGNSSQTTDRVITMEWVGANKNVQIIAEQKTADYHTYGMLLSKAFGYKKITFKNLYKGIDLVYRFNADNSGFEYDLVLHPGANVNDFKMRYGGNFKRIAKNKNGNILIESDVDVIQETRPLSYYSSKNIDKKSELIQSEFKISNTEVGFNFLAGYNKNKQVIIDPFVSSTASMNGTNAGKAKDIDFDYAGNMYVTGGGDVTTNHRMAKFDKDGILIWTFNGVLTVPVWEFGRNNGGWVVEKNTGKIYLGQGTNTGIRYFIRLNANGIYDNYIVGSTNFFKMWKMLWSCNNGTPEILVGGGGEFTNFNLMTFEPGANIFYFSAITGSTALDQNFADFLIDPVTNDLYSIFTCSNPGPVNNRIYKKGAPYAGPPVWSAPSGYTTLAANKNRPYLVANPFDDSENSANVLALNSNYLFYWDGKNLKAFDKVTGAVVGTPLTTANTALMQGGIVADACNNIFAGDVAGVIKVYKFNGTMFDDTPADIVVSGYGNSAVYDLAYDESKQLLYASGDGFAGSFDVSTYCSNNSFFNLVITTNCSNTSASANLFPLPPAGSALTYDLYNGNTVIASNNTGLFTGLLPAVTYKITATINANCSGFQISDTFRLATPAITTSILNSTCGNSNGQITASASGGVAPYLYSIDGLNFFPSGTFNGLMPALYNITVKDANGCTNTTPPLSIGSSTGITANAVVTNSTTCGNANGIITTIASGGVAPLQYSINGGASFQPSNLFTGLAAANYTVAVKDAGGCITTAAPVTVNNSVAINVTATPTNAVCGVANGSITALVNGGVVPILYSINGGANYQPSNIFNGMAAGSYTVMVKDAANCTGVSNPVAIISSSQLSAGVVTVNAECGFANGSISASVTGGVAPYQYSINGGAFFQQQPLFNNLAAATYTIVVKDAAGCSTQVNTVVNSLPIPILRVFAGNDTIVGINEPIQLNAADVNNAGFAKFEWLPAVGLNNNMLKSPVAVLNSDITYRLTATTLKGCTATDVISIKISKENKIIVPNAFTPNGDGINDLIKPVLIGIKKLNYFTIYNRYGQAIFTTNAKNTGWNGLINGSAQHTGTFVWVASGTDYNGNIISAKGTITMLR